MSLSPAADTVLRILVLLARQVEPVPAATVATGLGLPRSFQLAHPGKRRTLAWSQ